MNEYSMNGAKCQDIEQWDHSILYQLLERLRSDCNYDPGFGNRNIGADDTFARSMGRYLA